MSFRRELLPAARGFYENEVGQLTKPDRKGWRRGRCPFHQSKSGKSFSVHQDGAFFCHGCGVKGGDIIAFVRKREGLSFQDACKSLGCWEDGTQKREIKFPRGPLVPYLVFEFEMDGLRHSAEIVDKPKGEVQQLRRFAVEAAERLREIRNGDTEKFEGEQELHWKILADSWELIQIEVER